MGKNFLGLDGLKHFWTKAKTWIIDRITTEVTEAISGKADKIHTHTKSEITDFDHTHDDRYYTESEIDTKLSGKSDIGHTHTKSEITDFPKTVKFVDYRTGSLTFSSPTDQKKIELSNFGPEVTEDNVLSFMVIYWVGVHIIAQGDWAKSQGTGSTGLECSLHSLNNGTGYCVIRCVYLA